MTSFCSVRYGMLILLSCVLLAHVKAFVWSSERAEKLSRKSLSSSGGANAVDEQVERARYTPDDTAQELVAFLESKGAKGISDGVEIGVSNSGRRGVFSTRSFQPGERICSVPFLATIVIDQDYSDSTSDAQLGALFLANFLENSEGSRLWKPYLDALPTRDRCFDPTPDFFSEKEILSLELPCVIQRAMEKKQQIIALSLLEGMELESLKFATWLVTSRKFTISRKVNNMVRRRIVLIPFLDMLNHSSGDDNVELKVSEKESLYALQCTRPIPADAEITITYGTGRETPADLFVCYGFLPESSKGMSIARRLLFN